MSRLRAVMACVALLASSGCRELVSAIGDAAGGERRPCLRGDSVLLTTDTTLYWHPVLREWQPLVREPGDTIPRIECFGDQFPIEGLP